MLFDKFFVDFLYTKKMTSNNIIVLMSIWYILIYTGLYFFIFYNLMHSLKATILYVAMMGAFLFYRIYFIKRHLKNKIE